MKLSRIYYYKYSYTVKEKVWKNKKISRRTKIRILEATVMIVVKYGFEVRKLQKLEEGKSEPYLLLYLLPYSYNITYLLL